MIHWHVHEVWLGNIIHPWWWSLEHEWSSIFHDPVLAWKVTLIYQLKFLLYQGLHDPYHLFLSQNEFICGWFCGNTKSILLGTLHLELLVFWRFLAVARVSLDVFERSSDVCCSRRFNWNVSLRLSIRLIQWQTTWSTVLYFVDQSWWWISIVWAP